MKNILRTWRMWNNGRKFDRLGSRCRIPGRFVEVHGHVELGDNCRLRDFIVLRTRGEGRIVFGNFSGLSYHCVIEATKMVKIGNFSAMAEFGVIRDTNHLVIGTDEHWRLTPHVAEPIVIGDCVLITSRCYIGPGVAIGDGAVIAPNSVVTRDVPPYEIWGGNPAKKLMHRTKGVPGPLMRQCQELMERCGMRGTRYAYSDEAIREAARAGINRAAEERDRLKAELAASEYAGEDDL